MQKRKQKKNTNTGYHQNIDHVHSYLGYQSLSLVELCGMFVSANLEILLGFNALVVVYINQHSIEITSS